MRLVGVEVLIAPLRLREPTKSAGRTHHDRTTLFLRVVTDAGMGWGECAAYPGARWPDPTVSAVEPEVVDHVLGRLVAACPNGELPAAGRVASVLRAASVAEQAVIAAVEMAVLDAELQMTGQSTASWLDVSRAQVGSAAMVGIPERRDVDALVDRVGAAIEAGARRIRLKIEPGWERGPLEAVRDRFGDVALAADANGSFAPDRTPMLAGLDDLELVCLEQPFPPVDLAAHRVLAETMATPIALDESLWSPARVDEALAERAFRVACLKPGRLGGVVATLAAASACANAGAGCFVGGLFDSGLSRSLNAAIAGRAEFTLDGDLGDPDGYLESNPFAFLDTAGGLTTLSQLPGIGAVPRTELIGDDWGRRWIPGEP